LQLAKRLAAYPAVLESYIWNQMMDDVAISIEEPEGTGLHTNDIAMLRRSSYVIATFEKEEEDGKLFLDLSVHIATDIPIVMVSFMDYGALMTWFSTHDRFWEFLDKGAINGVRLEWH
ncbi:MAG: hypothetical protein V7629_21535, partial [Motiliproteus sp.]